MPKSVIVLSRTGFQPSGQSEPRTRPDRVSSLLSNSSLVSQCQTTIYKAISFVLDNSVSPQTLRNQIGNGLDWNQGFGGHCLLLPSEASLMTWKKEL